MIACFIRYQIDPFRAADFTRYAEGWADAIPRCGADLIGYFGPHEGSATTAYAAYAVPDLAAYETYRARLRADPQGRETFAFAQAERFIQREDRLFLKPLCGPYAR
jgi:hypothetical protein